MVGWVLATGLTTEPGLAVLLPGGTTIYFQAHPSYWQEAEPVAVGWGPQHNLWGAFPLQS